jgi:hypothetical protein
MRRKKKMPKTKKATRTVKFTNDNGDEVIVTQTFNLSDFDAAYKKFKQETSAVGNEAMKIKGKKDEKNLWEVISFHGVPDKQRDEAVKPVSPSESIEKQVLDKLEKLIKNNDELVTGELVNKIDELIKKLDEIRDSDADPRNIPFTVPIYRRVNKKTTQHDKKKHTKRWYGHYRVADYNNYRKLKAKVFNNKEYEETLGVVEKDWATTSENTSKPPFWQAIFGTKEDNSGKALVSEGLYSLLEKAKTMTEEIENEHVKLVLRGVARGGLAKDLYSIDDIKETLLQFLGTKDNIGNAVHPKTGNIRDDYMQRLFATKFSFIAETPAEMKNIREVYAIEKLPGTVKGYSLNITRGMVKSLFLQTGLCDRRSRKGPVYLKGYKTPAEKKEKETKKVKKSWIEVLTW